MSWSWLIVHPDYPSLTTLGWGLFVILIGLYFVGRSQYFQLGIWLLLIVMMAAILATIGLLNASTPFLLFRFLMYFNLVVLLGTALLTLRQTIAITVVCLTLTGVMIQWAQVQPDVGWTIFRFNGVAFTFLVGAGYLRELVQRRMETQAQALEASRARYQALFEALADPVCVHNNGVIRDVNPAFEQVIGYPREAIIGTNALDILSEETRQFLQSLEQEPDRYEGTVHKQDGALLHIEMNSRPVIMEADVPLRVTCIRDITARKETELALEAEHNLLRTVIDNIPDDIYVKDEASRFILVNQNIIDLYDSIDIIGKTDHELTDPEWADKFRSEELRIFQTGVAVRERELFIPVNDLNLTSEPTWLLIHKIPLRDANGRVTGIVGINRNITEKKKAELKLEEERNLLRTLIDNVPDHIFVKDCNGRFVLANRATQKHWDMDVIGKTDFDLMPQVIAKQNQADEQRLLATDTPINDKEIEVYDAAGRPQWLLSTKVPLYDHAKTLTGLVGINRPITELKMSQIALSRERNLLRAVIESVPDHIYVKDHKGRFILANPAILKYHDLENEAEILGKTDDDLFTEDEARAYRELDEHLLESGESIVWQEYEYPKEDGETEWYVISKIPLRDATGQPFGVLGIDRDITAQKAAEITVREERNLLRTVIDNVPDQIYVKNLDCIFVLTNQAVENHWGKAVIGLSDSDLITHTDPQPTMQAEMQLMATGVASIGVESEGVNHAGKRQWLSITKVPLHDSQGEVIGLVGFNRNLTQLKQVEDQLRQERNLLRTVMDNVPDHIYLKDRNHRFVLVNKQVKTFWGKDIQGLTDYDLQPHNDVDQIFRDEDQLFETGEATIGVPVSDVDTEGKPMWLSVTKVPVYDSDGQITGLVGINRVITDLKRIENELRNERNLLRTVIDVIPHHIYAKDRARRIVILNRHNVQAFDRPEEEIVGKTDFDLDMERAQYFWEKESYLLDTGEAIIDDETTIIGPDGNRRWLSITKVPLRDDQGEIRGLVGVNRDITDIKKAETKLREERNLLRAVIDNIPDQIYVKDLQHRIVLTNQATRERWHNDMIGMTDADLHPPEESVRLLTEEQQILESRQPMLNVERYEYLANGSQLWMSVTKLPLYDLSGEIIGLIGINQNITSRKQFEDHLRYHAELLENISDAVISTDTSFKIMSWNQGAERLYGWQADEVIGKQVDEVVAAQFVGEDEPLAASAEALFEDGHLTGEVMHSHRDGSLLQVYNITTLIRNDEETPTGIVAVNRDISEQKRAEQHRLDLLLERERVGVLRQVISDMSHDLKNPLANMRTSLYLLDRFADDPLKRRGYLENLDALTVRIETMLDDLLMMSRLEQLTDIFEFGDVRLDQLLEDIVREQQALADERQQQLELHESVMKASIRADLNKLHRALTNLVVNALNYTPEGGTVRLTCHREKSHIMIEVQDNGIGIHEDDQQLIFERFYRADKARSSRTGGSGLGLPIAKRIIEAHGGEITVKSEPNHGSMFTVRLPATFDDHDIS